MNLLSSNLVRFSINRVQQEDEVESLGRANLGLSIGYGLSTIKGLFSSSKCMYFSFPMYAYFNQITTPVKVIMLQISLHEYMLTFCLLNNPSENLSFSHPYETRNIPNTRWVPAKTLRPPNMFKIFWVWPNIDWSRWWVQQKRWHHVKNVRTSWVGPI